MKLKRLLKNLKSKGQGIIIKENIENKYQTVFGTVLIALSGCILYLDKAFNYVGYEGQVNSDYYDFDTLVWVMCQTISPILIIVGANFKPFRISYVIPLYCYCLQVYYVFFDLRIVEKEYTPYYAFVTAIGVYFLITYLKHLLNHLHAIKNVEIELLESIIESDDALLKKHGINIDG